jgi:FixJ family two-component response regulator
MTTEPTVFVVDDHAGARRSLRWLLESAGFAVETYGSPEEFLAAFDPDRPGCLVLDVRLRHGSGLDLQDDLRRRKATLPIIVLTGHGTVPISLRALQAGAFEFLEKPAPPDLLLARIGAAVESDRVARALAAKNAAVLAGVAQLTPREGAVMEGLLSGKTARAIAASLGVSVRTVERIRRMVFSKLRVTSTAQLLRSVLHARNPHPAPPA